ncbi:MAG: Lrp/AsnC ligand binding domain-containing protein [Proteobacteria bacterium]|nr:Lrp/AsnC ligand binding domain-containing protein [Pseudomonadota bacterium]MBU1583016.1 Lrp/AsnC ligand binding domain-containing protein [Pseudomonadota bacterium]MBU2454784.1 Lrp/AsnC ligand binding domain-containing protein [Pseudomonadota bacterium]MBU2627948.1 Lrp/AsnC ligand binding domain-containing protein [Pseudomonadota bacterium]
MKNFFKLLFSSEKNEEENHVSSFNEQQKKEEDVQFIDHGVKTVDLEKIIGSVGKYYDFDSQFRPKKHMSGKRFLDIKKAMRDGKPLPPVKLYQIRNDYYVLDGNHRVSAAKELGRFDIQAKVVELLSATNTMENLLYIEKTKFFETTGLAEDITLTEVGKYNFLENQIKNHKNHLTNISGTETDFKKAAEDWYNTIYKPLTTIITNGGLTKYFPKRSVADLYTYISYHHWERTSSRRYGIGIDRLIPKSMEAFRTAMLEKSTPDYPEMKRTITAFIMINIDTSTEVKVIDKLFALDEVQEVHSVHGTIDVLVKIVLKRDFLASDAEIIAEFVDQRIRRIHGINRTQTVIPGISKVKEGFMC